MTTETTERDLIEEVEELLAKAELPEHLYDIPHPEYAGANHRISDKPGAHWANFGHIATVVPSCARLFARSPELLRRMVEEVKRLRAHVADLNHDFDAAMKEADDSEELARRRQEGHWR